MKNIDKYLVLKSKYQEYVILIKSGNFYCTYLNDALLLRYFFNYQIIGNRVGFPLSVKNKVINFLKIKKISFAIVDGENIIINSTINNNYNELLNNAKEDYKYERELNDLLRIIRDKAKSNLDNFYKIEEYINEL